MKNEKPTGFWKCEAPTSEAFYTHVNMRTSEVGSISYLDIAVVFVE